MNNLAFDIPAVCGMGLHLKLDGFRILYSVIASFMWIVSAVFSVEYMSHYKKKGRYYFFLFLTYIATVGVFLSADFYTTFIFFEIMSLASYVWVAQDEREASLKAAGTYLAVAIIGGLVMLMGMFTMYFLVGTLNFDELTGVMGQAKMFEQLGYDAPLKLLWLSGLCLLFGFAAKAGAFPMHIWLPKAHPVAPAPASALLSGVLTKAGVFGILVLTGSVFVSDEKWGVLILITGVCTMVLGAVLAVFSIDLKRTLACSSVSQIGFILTGIGIAALIGEENGMAYRGSILHMVNHSLIKLVLFSAAGVVYMNVHSLDLNDVRGFGRKKPLLNIIFLMGALGIGGAPLWNGYISKTLIHESIVEYGELLREGFGGSILSPGNVKAVEWLFLISGGLTVAYMTKLYICLFVEKNALVEKQAAFDEKKIYMNKATSAVLIISALILPVLGMTPGLTMAKMADMAAGFVHAADMESVHYFSPANIKGALVSIAIGAVVYIGMVRTCLMDTDKDSASAYINPWPSWLDIETLIYRPLLQYALPFVCGTVCRVFDSLTDWIVVGLRKTIYKDSPIKTEYYEGNVLTVVLGSIVNGINALLNATFRRDRLKNDTDYKHVFAVKYTAYNENRSIIIRSMSFGLLLFCLGLVITVVYMFVKKLGI